MKSKILHLVLLSLPGLAFVSCDNEEEPQVNPTEYRISWIHSDDSYQLFEYDSSGRISEWKYGESATGQSAIQSTYEYTSGENVIAIISKEKRGDDTWNFDENLYLDQNGTASHAIGSVIVTRSDGGRLMKKNYTADFKYNSSAQLAGIKIVEKLADDSGWEETNGLELQVVLEWAGGNNLVKYSEFSNPEHPIITRAFTYYGGESAHNMPVVQGPILRPYYLPLQYQGILGRQSVGLVKEMTAASNDRSFVTTFSYDISTSVYSSIVESYSASRDSKETTFTLGWDTADNFKLNL